MSATSEALKGIMRGSIELTELQHARAQLRFVSALLAASMLSDLLDPSLLLLSATDSLIYRAAAATSPGARAMGCAFASLALLLVPYLLLQIGVSQRLERQQRGVTQVACLALAAVGVAWMFMAWQAVNSDLAVVPWIFARNAGGALLFAFFLSLTLNREQIRQLMERPS